MLNRHKNVNNLKFLNYICRFIHVKNFNLKLVYEYKNFNFRYRIIECFCTPFT